MEINDSFSHEKNYSYLKVKVIPNSSKNELISIMSDGTLKIRIKAIPEKGRANKELMLFLGDLIKIDKNHFEILSGISSQIKIIRFKKGIR